MNDILPDSNKVDLKPWSEAIRPSLSLWWIVFPGCRGHRPGLVTESGVPESVAPPPARGVGQGSQFLLGVLEAMAHTGSAHNLASRA